MNQKSISIRTKNIFYITECNVKHESVFLGHFVTFLEPDVTCATFGPMIARKIQLEMNTNKTELDYNIMKGTKYFVSL
jgi:hypothetical protein